VRAATIEKTNDAEREKQQSSFDMLAARNKTNL
jgi:hypothetical protein